MLSFFGLRKDSKKSSPSSERETDGFVIIGETSEEQRQSGQSRNAAYLSTNVIIQPSKPHSAALIKSPEPAQPSPTPPVSKPPAEPTYTDPVPVLSDLLGDIPFTLAPHILAMQAGPPGLPEFSLPRDINENLASFCYDFSLENSVLCEP
ncbi:UBAP1-MVB12-associated (UMA)-domain containing protein 1 [Trichomycterus rosablanca]|uniref:UBAP1-MVB12-associated (UMA)-domain containing protein 1 n=1 Tax=Trichomycterus rosablanca TaxID=2290929 RepID=UPI002F35835F